MELLNSGDKGLELFSREQGWIPFSDAYLKEAMEYRLRYAGDRENITIQDIPIPFFQQGDRFYGTFIAPFQSGTLKVSVNGEEFETFVYPDERKMTEQQFSVMLEEIMEEANLCFQYSGLQTMVSVSGRSQDISWTQWSYIERSFHKLRQIYGKIEKQPFRSLMRFSAITKREKVTRVQEETLRWLDKKGHGEEIPSHIHHMKTFETLNLYENQVLKQQLLHLFRLLKKYESLPYTDIAQKSGKYVSIIQRWLDSTFLKNINENKGPYSITQKFRKHPVYRMWYQWFDGLYKHKYEGIGFDYPISLKDTYQLYEIWCYMKIVKVLREAGYVEDTSGLFRAIKEGIFLKLAENHESRISLKDGVSLFYQRNYQWNSRRFYTFTQKMIPDIVLEGESKMIIFDPKYRVSANLGTALGEMHKYRDGILHRETERQAVQEVYILTPAGEELRYFRDDFQSKYRMGAIQVVPGEENECFCRKVVASVERVKDTGSILV